MNKTIRIISIACLITIAISAFCSCAPHNYDAHGIGNYRYYGDYNSKVEIDLFPGIDTLIKDIPYENGDYFYSYQERYDCIDILERGLYYFEYSEQNYEAAKACCMENCSYLGDRATEEYNGYQFYDFYEKRSKDDYNHGDDYPRAFKRVAFQDDKRVIVFLGIHTSDGQFREIKDSVADWEGFLRKYFFEFYRFEK